ncbi:MAG: DUF2062 domain-containing protein [Lentisphaeria bacterium]|nr:DUF2062 domain-containing protein [Lentisphaeria bacterium]
MKPSVSFDTQKIWCVIPVYNNAGTIRHVTAGCLACCDNVLIVDDGSTDAALKNTLADLPCEILTHDTNRGKGAAIVSALREVKKRGGSHMITIDGDGQHDPADIPVFFDIIAEDPAALIIGCRNFQTENVPRGSRFGRVFSNLWTKIETGLSLRDTQSGFRSYPVDLTMRLSLHGQRYDFEVEVLARAAWGGLPVKEVDVSVRYAPDRVSSFRPFKSNLIISLMHTRLVGRRLLPWPHRRLIEKQGPSDAWRLLKSPKAFIRSLLKENTSPAELAAAAAVGTVLAVLPLIGCHTPAIIYAAARLHLNKVMATAIQIFYSPPGVPFICIQVGYFIRHGHWWTDFTRKSLTTELHHRLLEWLIGSILLAPFYAIVAAAAVYWLATVIQRRKA